MRPARILIINPNSNEEVTRAIEAAVTPLAHPEVALDCVTLAEGPRGIETQADADRVPVPLQAKIAASTEYDAFIIACYSDPGLHGARELTPKPVFGIAECGLLTALSRGDRFGVIAIRSRAIPRHIRGLRQMMLTDRFAGERAIEMSVAESASGERTFERMLEVATQLRDLDGANVIVMGCAGMARHRKGLEAKLGIPVIDPTQAAVAMAIGVLRAQAD